MPTSMRRDRTVLKGTIPVVLLATTANVVFADAMPGAYDLYFKTSLGINVTAISSQNVNGFTLALGVTLAGSIDWVAVEQLG